MDSQRGVVLTALTLVLVLGSGAAAVGWLEATARSGHSARRSEAALANARDALIGYAVSYPDQHKGRHGPGYLPCPDTSGNGSPNTPCRRGVLGRIPWRRLGLHDPRDGAGEILWYAIADRFRANGYKHRPLNRETHAELEVDGRAGFAAVILAPGPALSFQHRERDRFDAAHYLEGSNARAADKTYASRAALPGPSRASSDQFNDQLVALGRDELMRAAGHRVLAETDTILRRFRDASWGTGVYPWLVPWNGLHDIDGVLPVPGTTAGRLPLSRSEGFVSTSFRLVGSPEGGMVVLRGTFDLASLDLPAEGLAIPSGRCMWTIAERIDCEGETRSALGPARERRYRVDVHFSGTASVTAPRPTDSRRRAVRGTEWLSDSYIEILDLEGGVEIGGGRMDFAPGPLLGSLQAEGIGYPLGEGAEVPRWLLENEWHASMLIGAGPSFLAGGSADASCAPGGGCLEIVRTSLDGGERRARVPAVAVLAGEALRHQNRDAPALGAWFEGENAEPANLRFETRRTGEFFNDQGAALGVPFHGPGS